MKNQWNERYDRSDYYYGKDPNSFLMEQKSILLPGKKVLCLAEGEGRNAVALAKIGCEVTAVDLSKVGLEKLERLAIENQVQVKTVCNDLNYFVFENDSWDFIISIWCHLPSSLRAKVHRGSVGALKSGGYFILEAYTPNQLKFNTGGPKDSDMMPTSALLDEELTGLSFLLNREIEREVSEGIGHIGRSAVVQVLAKKT